MWQWQEVGVEVPVRCVCECQGSLGVLVLFYLYVGPRIELTWSDRHLYLVSHLTRALLQEILEKIQNSVFLHALQKQF